MNILIFSIQDKAYGIDITLVREVICLVKVVPVPEAAPFVEGIISMRGKVIPLISLRKKMGLEYQGNSKSTRIIVAQISSHTIGFIADEVIEVVHLDPASVTLPDELLKEAQYLTGISKVKGRLVLLMDIEKLLSQADHAGIQNVNDRVEVRKKVC
ncbi:MAG: chemotaxis protein CheW [Candidatus Omnitrophica bacterium]|nr:chemotaxis protein CheW [Candidatus Omnitrophota bacterium]